MSEAGRARRGHADPVRDAILAAATTLFASEGYERTRIMDIAARAEVSYTSIYAKFESKRALYEQATGAPVPPQPAARQRITVRGRRTRLALLSEARDIFEREGFSRARVVGICDAVGVAPATFYAYFPSKGHLFREIAVAATRELYERSELNTDLVADEPVALVREATHRYLEAHAAHGRILAVLEEAATVEPTLARLRQAVRGAFVRRAAAGIRHLQEAGHASADIRAETAAAALFAMTERWAQLHSDPYQRHDTEEEIEALTVLAARALGIPATPATASGLQTAPPVPVGPSARAAMSARGA